MLSRIITTGIAIIFCSFFGAAIAAELPEAKEQVDKLEKPLYNPFVERYILDEVKQLRVELAEAKLALNQKILDREHNSVDRAVRYATDTVTYFFYLIAAATSILVLVGWTSLRDIKERVQSTADKKITKLVNDYEQRLESIEYQLKQKTVHIEENKEEIEMTQEIQSLWLRSQQENLPQQKIAIYDQILKLRHDDCEAMTYKADAVLELNEPKWAINLCNQVLRIDKEHAHAYYQLACAYTLSEDYENAVLNLREAIRRDESYRLDILKDAALAGLHKFDAFKELAKTEY